ncbi:MAG TPA: oligosaccharide flippase family protein [Candidatus Saccharimonadales bacterium]|nr:oligosaccharide flippase family protein [Candidatus Saccharimonadales bacterium]
MKEKIRQLHSDSLVRNSFYLMLSTGIMAVLGFVFWFIAARMFSPADIGIATTLISAMNLISYIGLLGFNSTFIRMLPTSKNRSSEMNTGLILGTGAAIAAATAYILLVPTIAPALSLVHDNPLYAIGFIAMTAMASVNLLTDSIFIAFRAAKYNLFIDGIVMSLVKLALPFAFVGLGAYGLFAASGAAAVSALVLSLFFLIKNFEYRPRLNLDKSTLNGVVKYSLANYVANLLNIAPTLILPLVIINHLGPANAGYYYLGFMVANLLYTVVYAVSQSLFAEGSYADRGLRELMKRGSVVIAAIMIPGAAAIYFGATLLLSVYGGSYAVEAAPLLQIFALAGPLVAVYTIANVLLRITKQTWAIIIVNVVYMVSIGGFAELWAGNGLVWIGYAWLVGHILASATALGFLGWKLRRDSQALV